MSSKSIIFDKASLIILTKMAQQTERYEEMISFADQIYKLNQQLTPEERNLCATAYKNLIGVKRAELKTLNAVEQKQEQGHTPNKILQKIKQQIRLACKNILGLIDKQLMPRITSVQDTIFYLKMKGDYNRYLCQFFEGEQSSKCLDLARSSYQRAADLARSNLASTNPVRLGLNLNMSVFCYQILGKRQRALQIANRAFQQSISNIDNMNQVDYKDCTFIIQLLRDNITLWSSEEES